MTTKKSTPGKGAQETFNDFRDKDNHYFQFQRTQIEFFRTPATMMQIAKTVGCDRANICWFVRDLRRADAIWVTRIGICPVTRHSRVKFWTTNPKFVESQPQQPKLF